MNAPLRVALAPELDLRVGAAVVYARHGVGRISDRSTHPSAGAEGAMVVVEFESGLSVSLPLERAKACLRPPAGSSELEAVSATLTASEAPAEQSWQMRTRTTREKIALGDPVALAEIVRDAVERQRRLSSGSLSSLERELYEKARSLLAGELAVAACIDDAEAQEWISSRLALGAPTTLVP